MKKLLATLFFAILVTAVKSQTYELNSGWKMINYKEIGADGSQIATVAYDTQNWMPATVPGTVLTSLLNQKKVPDPFYGMNNNEIPDINEVGNDHYTYWFVKDFTETATLGEQVWLNFRGINYKAEIYINGKKVNVQTHEGMHLRVQFNITKFLNASGKNRLAVLVYPPTIPGNANGGQGGDGMIAKNLTTQYTAGWDWIKPIRDRNTGIWDKVTIEKTKSVNLKNPHVVTLVPGLRNVTGLQQDATIKMSVELQNPTAKPISGVLQYTIAGETVKQNAVIEAGKTKEISFRNLALKNPKLWWPSGYGPQNLYDVKIQFVSNGVVQDMETLKVGVRQINYVWNDHTKSMETLVNGQRIFIKGGNWIISDAMLRFSDTRYDAEIRYHKDMNLNLIRIWGGALIERPEFYEACDRYGLLVFQDFWFSGDCNGRWLDPMKKEDQWTRRKYPDDHGLVLKAMEDQIKMVRNHASLAFWCGGNEIPPPEDILNPLKNDLLPRLDGTRILFDFSNSDVMSYNELGGNGDGPYSIQDPNTFWATKTFPFNSEVGSVGVGDYVSLQRFIPEKNLVVPKPGEKADAVWEYHCYIPYENYIDAYGKPKDAEDFAMKAQLLNYDQYRALMEGFSSHMWDWYTGTIIWKTQNPWTALRGQMYDYYLDPNACLYGLRTGSKPLHIMMDPTDGMVQVVNNGFETVNNLMLQAKVYNAKGKDTLYTQVFNTIGPSSVRKYFAMKDFISKLGDEAVFVSLRMLDQNQKVVDDNLYWLKSKDGDYAGLKSLKNTNLTVNAIQKGNRKVVVTLSNSKGNPVAFFNRIALIDKQSGKRILPSFYDDNYVSVLPGEEKKIEVEYTGNPQNLAIEYYGWNVDKKVVEIR